VASALSRVGQIERGDEQLKQAKPASSARSVKVMLANVSREELTFPNATVLGVAEEISEKLVDAINDEMSTDTRFFTKRANSRLYYKLLKDKLDHLDSKEK
jgi:hypothetical protein